MKQSTIIHATCTVERSFTRPPHVVFAALSQPEQIRQWMGGDDHSELLDFTCDFREGGSERFQYRMGPETPIAGQILTSDGCFQHIVPDSRILIVSTMRLGDHLFSASQVTFELQETATGTDLILTHQGVFLEGSDGPAMREQGWNILLDRLVRLVHGR